ncbi:NADH-quinone oxidoreductase subunit G [Propionibacterium freudenreichii]|uniref:NADH-quinone oxidoreductase subunit G n=1 Tax=Propionibacterium freudenreichii TaxID=1744 RepID=UPI0022B85B89|nr:NADH-quinone oxidoreductase subunit G [Propionibacterium freudenreichii]WBF62597.1 NADH-quinone oxidoreductase subunit G [Propionibacterium freudenreichii]
MSTDTKSSEVATKPDLVTFTIDGAEVSVPKGTLVIRAAEMIGIDIPRFCDHPLLDPVAACRVCLVEVPDAGNGRAMKPQPACALSAMPGMKVETADSNPTVAKHQSGMIEFLLINHPLDCPICDKGGECPLQNQAMSHGRGETRYEGVKRTYAKPTHINAEIVFDRERCILCQRCTRFSEQISGDDFISLSERGAFSQVGEYADQPYASYFGGNIIQICPVGALTSADYRFQSRPDDLVSTQSSCEHCASGCELRVDHRHFQVKRRLAGNEPAVNEEWNCDKGRFGFRSGHGDDRITTPLVRRNGALEPASWPEAIDAAAEGLSRAGKSVGFLPGGRLTVENAFAYSRFARAVVGSNDIDFRSRAASAEEETFLTNHVVGRKLADSVTFGALEKATKVVLVSFEPEDESPMVFLRLRKAWRKNKLQVVSLAPFATRGSEKMGARLWPTAPGTEAAELDKLAAAGELDDQTIILVGERAALSAGALTKVAELAERTGAGFAWIPRRAGELGALEAGLLPGLLPGGRHVADASARVDVQAAWGADQLPAQSGRDAAAIIRDVASGSVEALVTAGIQAEDFADPDAVLAAVSAAGFVVSLEQRRSEIADRADVVLPVALIEDQVGTFINWEHRERPVALVNEETTSPMTDVRVLAALADALGSDLGMRTPTQARLAFDEISDWSGNADKLPVEAPATTDAGSGNFVLSSWRLLIDDAAGLDGATALLETAPAPSVRLAPADATGLGVADGQAVTVRVGGTTFTAPLTIVPSMVPGVVWVPGNTRNSVNSGLVAAAGTRVEVTGGAA